MIKIIITKPRDVYDILEIGLIWAVPLVAGLGAYLFLDWIVGVMFR